MSNRQMSMDEEEKTFECYDGDEFLFDSDTDSCYSDYGEEDAEILEKLEQKREEEQRQKDQNQIYGLRFLNIPDKYSWQPPANEESIRREGFPGLLESRRLLSKTHGSTPTRGAGFSKHIPKIVVGNKNDFSVKPVICSYFLKGNCTRPDCTFYHPINEKCKFDKTCTNPKCVFVHSSRENKTTVIQSTTEQKDNIKPQNGEKCKHRICLHIFQIVNNKIVATKKNCKYGDSCNFAHNIGEVVVAIKANQEKFKCNYGSKCKHVNLVISEAVIKDKQTKIFKYQNKNEFCECPRVHSKESVQDFIVRVQTARRPQQKNKA